MGETNIILSRGGFPPLSARGCQQTLEPIERGDFKRTIKGDLIYLGRHTHHKYKSIVACQDKEAPALESLWKGEEIQVGCIQRLWQKPANSQVKLERPPRPHSIIVLKEGKPFSQFEAQGNVIQIDEWQNVLVGYQPILNMVLVDFTIQYHEWAHTSGWTLKLLEA